MSMSFSSVQNTSSRYTDRDSQQNDQNNYYSMHAQNRDASLREAAGLKNGKTVDQSTLEINPIPTNDVFQEVIDKLLNSSDVLDVVMAVFLLSSNEIGDTARRETNELNKFTQKTRELKQIADGIDAMQKYVKGQRDNASKTNPPKYGYKDMLDDPTYGPTIKTALKVAGWDSADITNNENFKSAMNDLSTTLSSDVSAIDPDIDSSKLSSEFGDLNLFFTQDKTAPSNVDGDLTDIYKFADTAISESSSLNQAKSSELQSTTTTYQMAMSLVTSLIQRRQDLASKTTNLS